MKLYKLSSNFIELSSSERIEFLRSYRAKRAMELEENIKNKKESRILLSDEEKALIKVLGITQKDLKTLKRSIDSEK